LIDDGCNDGWRARHEASGLIDGWGPSSGGVQIEYAYLQSIYGYNLCICDVYKINFMSYFSFFNSSSQTHFLTSASLMRLIRDVFFLHTSLMTHYQRRGFLRLCCIHITDVNLEMRIFIVSN